MTALGDPAALGNQRPYRDQTAYDACYVGAAAQLDVPLLTADRKLVAALASTQLDIRWLAHALPEG